MEKIDFRSDTVTHPTPNMRQAMANAIVGDDVFGDDPTVIELETLAASMVGKEAALFVPSGVFGNQLCIFTHAERGSEIIVSRDSHVFKNENGALSIIAGVQTVSLENKCGILDPSLVESVIRKPKGDVAKIHQPKTTVLCLENALCNGRVVPLDRMKELFAVAKKYGLKVHLDGARIFNAAISLKTTPQEIAACCDSVMFCLSKGLCAPIGSIVAGSKEFIEHARFKRKLMGGALRQVGVIASAGIIALKEQVEHLVKDHCIAKLLCEELAKIEKLEVFPEEVEINFVFFKIKNEKEGEVEKLEAFLKENGILTSLEAKGGKNRLVTHFYIREKEVKKLSEVMKAFFEAEKGGEADMKK